MRTRTKSYGDDLEIREITVNKALTITIEIFKVPEGFKSFARNSYIHHDHLLGAGLHEDKEGSVEFAIKEL
ncbi:hypothetical protein [Neobacillus massiliamazoniensis]|uniref:Uncharacterized protein n=1 Tax=Neobacillus massiliamazoniensis TaxID=1499688 RepID=A0A0U1NQ60_9BACI|nr:hypothetical protein [Neobacillus massiliamazoniensis]CRK80181.1 hypothetical protein BN000_00062 [Neobacillus massiliamazoniensis]